jgi:16S rRNA (adenine1518-N6/adenine1519-N6)-dimethyltransferase
LINNSAPKKSLSQNYLHDDNISRKIVETFNPKENETVIELGSGQGALTEYLANKTQNLILVELDKNNCEILHNKFANLEILNENILELDFSGFSKKVRIIGNIPYNITSGILFKLIDNRRMISDAMLMVQEEVARRLTAKPNSKDYGITSVFTQIFSKPTLLFKISKNCFFPKPKVDSRMISFDFTINLEDKIDDINFFRIFVRTAFGKRRKMLSNTMKEIGIETKKLDIAFDFKRRPESLSIKEFIDLSNMVRKNK